jgi:glutamate mutase epsilon subunit
VDNHPDVTDPAALDRLVEGALVHRDILVADGRLSDDAIAKGIAFATEQGTIDAPVAPSDAYTWEYLPQPDQSAKP